ncbi:MAG: serine/threonine protein phosphatase [Myxococcota bacterium]|nr:serine/threonine protein phosphatase [Myxococcota bacterium]
MRTLVVGDVHGCLAELEALLAKVRFEPGHDRLVLVGDLVAKGPSSKGVVALARATGALAVRGNHDEHVLRWYRAKRDGRPLPELGRSHREVCASLDDDDWAYLDALPTSLRLAGALTDRDVLVVHAALDPSRTLDAQSEDVLLNGRSLRADGTVSMRVDDGAPWASAWPGPELVLFGHDAIRKLQRHPHAIGLDTGCVYGGELSCAVLDGDATDPSRTLAIVSVPAARVYSEPKGSR